MQIQNGTPRLSATDLVGYLNCRHLTQLEHAAARGELSRPKFFDPALEALWERGKQHEHAYVEHLRAQGLSSVVIDGVDITEEAVAQTIAAMRAGVRVAAFFFQSPVRCSLIDQSASSNGLSACLD